MSIVNAATRTKVLYVASLALRSGQVPSVTSVVMPTLSQSQATTIVNGTTATIKAGVHNHRNAAPAPHQAKLVAAMAAVSGVQAPQLTNRWHADQVAIAWFKRYTVVSSTVSAEMAKTNMVALLEQLELGSAAAAA